MGTDTHKVHWQVSHPGSTTEPREFVSLTKALRFIRDESAIAKDASSGPVELITDDITVASFSNHDDTIRISDDAISLVQDAWTALDD